MTSMSQSYELQPSQRNAQICKKYSESWEPNPLNKCAMYMQKKLEKSNMSKGSSCQATSPNQGISINFGFIVQTSKIDESTKSCLQGLNHETYYCLIIDYSSGTFMVNI